MILGCHNAGMTTWQNKVIAMEGRGWSLTKLAQSCGAHVSSMSDLKQGRTKAPRADVGLQLHHLYSTGAAPELKPKD